MSRLYSINNRNIKIIAAYVKSKTGSHESLFEDLSYPCDAFESAADFFLDEDEWTTYENFEKIFRRARKSVGEPDFYFTCGFSSASLRSWGRFHVFSKLFISPGDGFKRLPFFNKNLNDTKEIDIVFPPAYDSRLRKFRTILKVEFHRDMDPNSDYIGDPFLRGVISAIPTLWGLEPASIRQPLKQYDPEILFSREPEFAPYQLQPKKEGDLLTIRHPGHGGRSIVGERVFLLPEQVGERKLFLGRFTKNKADTMNVNGQREAMLITETVKANGRTLLREGDLFMAPYFILDVTYDRISLFHRLVNAFSKGKKGGRPDAELIATLNQLRGSIQSKNEAFAALEDAHLKLQEAKKQIDGHAAILKQKVKERTAELDRAREELLELNRNLESRVQTQLGQLERTNRLRRYLSPKITEMILAEESTAEKKSERKMMTVVFSDIRGFSNLTDGLEPEEIVHLLDRYLSEMIETVHRFDGTLDKIIGDGLLIFFGDPIPVEDHAKRAVLMALEMQKKVSDLRSEWIQYGHELAIGIGINTGYMTVGNIGPENHRDYTVIGNQVNVAARLESLAGPGQILVSQRTMSRVQDLVEAEYVDEIKVKGIHSPVKTYDIRRLKEMDAPRSL
ncbi:MAG: adenylate/guanylate cyclase domain-containing protein [Desulfatiglandaceae bacterium]